MEPLTPREVEVARLVVAGQSYKRIASDLGISVATVQSHVVNAAEKLGGPGASPKMRLVVFVVNLLKEEANGRRAS